MGKTLIIGFLFFFFAGYSSFFTSVSIGPRPPTWRHVGAVRALEDAFQACDNLSGRSPLIVCVRNHVAAGIRVWGLHAMMLALEEKRSSGDPQDITHVYCHDIAHALGQAGGEQSHDIVRIFEQCTATCNNGCYHGAAEGWVRQGNSLGAQLPTMCDSVIRSLQEQQDCAHGVGHAIPTATNYVLNASLDLCDLMAKELRVFCGWGVFMELFEPISYTTQAMPLPPNHPEWCQGVRWPYDEVCFTRSGTYEYHNSGSLDRAVSVCYEVSPDYQYECILGLGRQAISPQASDPESRKAAEQFCKNEAYKWASQCMREIFVE